MTTYISEFNAYLENEKKCSDTTLKAYTSDIEEFLAYIKATYEKSPTTVTRADVEAFLNDMKENGRSSSTINRKLSSIRAYYVFLLEIRKIRNNPVDGLKSAKVSSKSVDYLSVPEVESLLSQPDDSWKGIRDRALLEMMYATGMRASEVCAVKIEDLNLTIGFVSCCAEQGKTRMIPLGRPAKKAISEYITGGSRNSFLAGKEDQGYLFLNFLGESLTRQGVWKIMKFYGEKAGLGSRISPQILRNSFTAHMIINGADLKSLQELLGTEDITSMKLFLSLSKKRIIDVYDRAFPRAK